MTCCKKINICVSILNTCHCLTTDVQKISAMTLGGDHTFIVQCEFITGSDAQGCITANLTRNSKSILETLAVATAPPPPPRFSGSMHTIYGDTYFLDRQTLTSQLSSVLTCKALAMLKAA